MSDEKKKQTCVCADCGSEVIPGHVGVPVLGFEEEDDYSWHEFVKLETTTMEANDEKGRSIAEFADELEKIGPDGWEKYTPDPETMVPGH